MYNLNVLGKLPEDYKIIGVGRREYTNQEFIEIIQKWVKEFSRLDYSEEKFNDLAKKIVYFKLDMKDVMAYEELSLLSKKQHCR